MTVGNIITVMGLTVFAVEVVIQITKRAQNYNVIVSDGKSLRLIWKTIGIGIGVASITKILLPHPLFTGHSFEYWAAALIVSGMALRWFSMYYLAKEFNVNIAIIEGHRLVTSGPYQLVRHPSHTGLLLICLGLGIHFNHIVGMLALTIPVCLATLYRIVIEEVAMKAFFGVEYAMYRERTKKLLPYVY